MDENAPHGYEEDGVTPRAPYGLRSDGKPRKSNRGARPGQRGNGNRAAPRRPGGTKKSPSDAIRMQQLCALGDMLVISPLSAASMTPGLAKKIGQGQCDALAGDAVILTEYMPKLAEGLIVLSQSKPAALAWLDQVEDKAPYLLLLNVGVQVGKALVSNHMNPNPRLAHAGRLQGAIRSLQLAEAIEAQAAEMGISFGSDEPTIPIPDDEAA